MKSLNNSAETNSQIQGSLINKSCQIKKLRENMYLLDNWPFVSVGAWCTGPRSILLQTSQRR